MLSGVVSRAGGPWCYTTDPEVEWEYCNVTECGKYQYARTARNIEYQESTYRYKKMKAYSQLIFGSSMTQTEVLCTQNSTRMTGFKLMTSKS